MSAPARVGMIGCGVISGQYAKNAQAFDSFEIVACADLVTTQAESRGAEFGFAVATVDDVIGDPSIDMVLNLTPPAAHAVVTRAALAAGKHVYSEKPLAITTAEAEELVAEADRLGLRIGCAPDTFLGGPYQAARALLDEGAIGEPLSVSAAMLTGGQETWHPNPDIFVADGAGPLLDMAPYYLTAIAALIGPVRRVAGFASTRVLERAIEVGPRAGESFAAATPTHTAAAMELDGGVTGLLVASFDTHDQYIAELEIHGTEGKLALPDPNAFAPPVRLSRDLGAWEEVPVASRGPCDSRGIGLHELVEAIAANRPHRASAQLGLHVVEVACSLLAAAAEGRTIEIASSPDRPVAMPVQ
jgi:predicted dehydrogenase